MHKQFKGFTIVELLIVIVVIGILATITVIAYAGIRTKAVEASLISDAESAAKLLTNDNTINGVYPSSGSAANSGKGLPTSGGNTYAYTPNNSTNPPSYSLTYSNSAYGNGSFIVTSTNPTPTRVTGSPPSITTPLTAIVANTDGCGADYYKFYLNSTASGSPTPSVQWQIMSPKNTMSGTWSNISGATTSFYAYESGYGFISPDEYFVFRAIWTSGSFTTISPTIQLTLTNGC